MLTVTTENDAKCPEFPFGTKEENTTVLDRVRVGEVSTDFDWYL